MTRIISHISAYGKQAMSALVLLALFASLFTPASLTSTAFAASPTINYQGKLMTSANVAVPNGTYNMRFWIIASPSAATSTALWTESLTSANRVQVTNGLFSVMLGSTTPLTGIDFSQTPLYLGVEIGGTGGSPTWDGEMLPRKIIGTVPAAFYSATSTYAQTASTSNLLSGIASSSFLRSDQADDASGLLTFTGGLISTASSTINNLTITNATTTALVINGSRFTSLTGTGLVNTGGVLTVSTSSLGFGTLASLNSVDISSNTNLTVSATGLTLSNDDIALTAGYSIPLTASTTEWAAASASTTALTPAYLRGLFSNTATGLTYNSGTGATSLTAGYNIPLTASTTEWASTRDTVSAGSASWNAAAASTTALTPAYLRGLFSNTATGLTYTSGTGATSLTAGYNIPLTASTTEWANKVSSQWTTSGANISYSAGSVGIGTNPSALLHVSATYAAPVGGIGSSTVAIFSRNNTANGTSTISILSRSSAASGINFGSENAERTGFLDYVHAQGMIFGVGASERMRINGSGFLGIGTTTPSHLLTVAGDANITGALRFNGNAGTSGYVLQSTGTGAQWVATSTLGFSSAAITSLNGQTGATQTFATGTATGIGLTVTSVGNVHTFTPTVTAGYNIPLTASTTEWASTRDTVSAGSASWNAAAASTTALTPAYLRGLFSNTATGLTYNSGTGATSLTAGYNIPLTASTTEWANKVSSQWVTTGSHIYYNTGNVGVGTTTPYAAVSVGAKSGTDATDGSRGVDPSGLLVHLDNTSSKYAAAFVNDGANNAGVLIKSINTQLNVVNQSNVSSLYVNAGKVGMSNTNPYGTLSVGDLATSSITDGSIQGGALLHVRGSASGAYAAAIQNNHSNSHGLLIQAGSTNSRGLVVQDYTGSTTYFGIYGGKSAFGTSSPKNTLDIVGAAVIGSSYGGVNTAPSDGLLVEGNVGIGTTTPSAKLAITGTAGIGDIFAVASSTNARLFTVKSSGNVGIGTQSPASKLTIYQSSYTATEGLTFDSTDGNAANNGIFRVAASQIAIKTGGTDVYFDAGDIRSSSGFRLENDTGASTTPTYTFNGDANTGMYNPSADALSFSTGGLDRVRITSAGNVGIGTTSPPHLLTVAGDTNITGALRFNGNSGTAGQVLISNGASAPTWTATSSLGLSSVFSNSAQLAALLSDETGTAGNVVFSGGPTFTGNTTLANASTTNLTVSTNSYLGTVQSGTWNGSAVDISSYTNLSVSATGLSLSGDAVALTAGYNIPLTASTTNWNSFWDAPSSRITAGTGFAWSGNTFGAAAGYSIPLTASTTEWATTRNTVTAGSASWNAAAASTTALTPAYLRGLFSNTATGLTYNSGTGATSLTAGYNIPLTASTTNWNSFWDAPSSRITAGTGLAWSGNTFGAAAGYSIPLTASTTEWATTRNTVTAGSASWNAAAASTTALTPAYLRGLFSNSATGLTYNSTTGGTSLTAGYTIPLTASTTEWANKVSSQWTTSGANIYYNTGNVGIGTTTPITNFSVVGSGIFTLGLGVGRLNTNAGVVDANIGYRIAGAAASGNYLRGNGTNFVSSPISAGDIPTLNQDTTGTAYYLDFRDTRAVNDEPDDFDSLVKFDFKQNSTNGLSDGGTYNGVMTWRKYGNTTDFSGGPAFQLSYSDNGNLWTRLSASSTAWASWVKLLNTSTIDTSAELAGILTDETGTAGSVVFSGGPTFTGNTTLANASTTNLTNSGNAYLGTVQSGTWQGTALTDAYVSDTLTLGAGSTLADDLIIEPDLSADVAAADGDFLQYDSTGTNFTWRDAGEVRSDLGLVIGTNVQAWDTQLDDVADGTFTTDFVNTTNPWADNEVADVLTVTGGTLGSNTITSGATWTTGGTLTIGDGGDRIDIASNTWDVTNGVITGATWNGTDVDVSDYTNLAVSATGLSLSGDSVALTAGYIIPLTASTTEWHNKVSSQWTTSGSNIYYNTGNVGIGTTSPSHLLTVAGDTNITGALRFNGNAGTSGYVLQSTGSGAQWVATSTLGFSGGSGANAALSNLASVAINTSLLPASDDSIDLGDNTHRWRDLFLGGETLHLGASTADEGLMSYNTSSNILNFSTDSTSNGDIAFFTDDLYLDKSTGNVGIGTTTPGEMLTIEGGLFANSAKFVTEAQFVRASTGQYGIALFDDGGNPALDIGWPSAQGLFTIRDDSGNAGMEFRGDPSNPSYILGSFGIGTATPSAKLHITGTAGSSDIFNVSSSTNETMFVVGANGNVGIGTSSPTARLAITGTAGTADIFAIASSTNARLFTVKSTGNVGIGTSSPSQLLNVYGTNAQALLEEGPTEFLRAGVGETSNQSIIGWHDNDALIFGTYSSSTDNTITQVAALSAVSGQFVVNSIVTGNTEITGTLNVFGGTGSTGQVLLNNGAGMAWVSTSTLGIGGSGAVNSGTSGYFAYYPSTGTTVDDQTILYTNGSSIGIGNSSPGALLDLGLAGSRLGVIRLAGSTSGNVTVQASTTAGTWTLTLPSAAGTNGQQLTTNGSGVTKWAAASSLRDQKNIVGLVTSPEDALSTLLATNIYTFHYKEGMGTGDSETEYVGVMADESPWAMHYNGTIINPVNTLGYMVLGIKGLHNEMAPYLSTLSVDGGSIGIGTTTPQRMLHVVSESAGAPARFQDANAYCDIDPTSSTLVCTSDRRLKENIESLDSATVLSRLAELRPVSFVWKSDASHTERTGLIAQEVAEVFPDLVTTDSVTGYKSVAYGGFTPYLLAGVGELAKERTQLAALLSTGTSTFASTSPFYALVNAQDTVWSRMVTLAQNFVDGVLTLSGVKADRVDVGDMLCVGDVCVDEETFLNMVQQAGQASQSSGGGEMEDGTSTPQEPPAEEPPVLETPGSEEPPESEESLAPEPPAETP